MKSTTVLRKTFTTLLTFPPETETVLKRLMSLLIPIWNAAVQQSLEWLALPTEDPLKKPLTAISYNYWLKAIDKTGLTTDLCRQLMVKLAGSFASYFELKKRNDKRARIPREKTLGDYITLSWSKFKIREIEDGIVLELPIGNRQKIAIPLDAYLKNRLGFLPGSLKDKIKYVTISKREGDRFKLSIVCAYPAPTPIDSPRSVRAIDLGAGDIAVSDSTGKQYLIPCRRPDKHWMKCIASVEGRVEKCKKTSLAYKRRMKARKKMHAKAHCQHNDHQRKLANALCRGVDVVVIGKPKTRLGLAQSVNGTPDQHFGAQNTGYLLRLLIFIREKAGERGIRVIELPDPQRMGSLSDPDSKFHASTRLLDDACKKHGIEMPRRFVQSKFVVNQ